MKKLKTWLVTIVALLCSTTVRAHDFGVDGIYYKITSDADLTVAVTYMGEDNSSAIYNGSVVIPEKVKYEDCTYTVTSIGDCAFLYCTDLIDITFPSSVKSIKNSAFYGCEGLTNITIPSSVETIESCAFQGTSLTNITIPNSVVSIGDWAFSYCNDLTDVTIPESVTNIGECAFYDCTSLPVEDNIRYAGAWAVEVTDKTLTRYTLRENTIGLIGTFSGCTSLVRITLPASLMYIGDYAFNNCGTLKSLVLPEGVINIGNHAFDNCNNLTSINIPSKVSSIGEYAFYDCN